MQIAEALEPALAARLDPLIDAALAEGRIAGGVALVARAGKLAYARAAGLADIPSGRPVALDTIFRAASLTKPLVTAAALALVEAGVIGLDDPVTRFLPDFTPKFDGQTPTISLRQLLTHTAGLSYGFMQPDDGPYLKLKVSDGLDQPGVGFAENLAKIVEAGLFYPPGAGWIYSVAIDVLGAAMEQAAGQGLHDILTERVCARLGLADTGFRITDRARLATAYADGPPPRPMGEAYVAPFAGLSGIRFAPDRIFDPGSFPSGGAGAACTATDFLTFLEAMRTGGGGVVGEATTRAMMTNQIGDIPTISGPGSGFGFGGAVVVDPVAAASPLSAGAWRWGGVYGHSWFVDPARELSFVLMTNTAVEGMSGQLSQELAAAAATG
ncbi:serine hydrolase domain-containing protein [Caulobacter sp. KR2-114]|uniref:serine hydrolase domain-containing protein n=1 Tax=Caulobacter sp. KR2-114 TaxID=3400912 RepID=UPI003BFC4C10